MYDPNSQDPTKNIFAYGGNTIDAQTGVATPVKGTIPGYQTINSSVLAPTTPINYSTPNPTPVPSVSGLDTAYSSPALAPTAPEQNATDINSRIRALNDSLVGKSAYTTEQKTAAGIPGLEKTQQDLATQIKQLQSEALAIPQQLQVQATGQGITTAGLAPLQTARLRTNSIAALGASALLDATNGLLASAQKKVDAAVSAKYDPIQEEIDAATKNLQLILNDPAYTLAEKNRAQAQLDIQNKKKDALAKSKEDSATIMSWAVAAVKNGATPVQAQQLTQIANSDNPDLQSAFKLYAPFAQDPNALQKQILDLQKQRADIANTQASTQKIRQETANLGKTSINSSVLMTDNMGRQISVPIDIAPYYNTSYNGTAYIDASTLQGTAAEKKSVVDQATKAGIKVITNKNTVADLSNINDANNKLDTISTIMVGIDQPNALSRDLYGFGLTKLATLAQSNPQQAAAGALQSIGLDILKAISGVQGFRGNQTSVQQVTDHLPTIYDTNDVVQQKVDYIRQLITDRENGLLGTKNNTTLMTGPDGVDYNVPNNQIDAFTKAGGKKK